MGALPCPWRRVRVLPLSVGKTATRGFGVDRSQSWWPRDDDELSPLQLMRDDRSYSNRESVRRRICEDRRERESALSSGCCRIVADDPECVDDAYRCVTRGGVRNGTTGIAVGDWTVAVLLFVAHVGQQTDPRLDVGRGENDIEDRPSRDPFEVGRGGPVVVTAGQSDLGDVGA